MCQRKNRERVRRRRATARREERRGVAPLFKEFVLPFVTVHVVRVFFEFSLSFGAYV